MEHGRVLHEKRAQGQKQMNANSQEDFSTFEYLLGRAKSALPLFGGSLAVDRRATSAGPSCVNNKSLVENPFSASGGGKRRSSTNFDWPNVPGDFLCLVHCKLLVVSRYPRVVEAECNATIVRPLCSA